VDKGKEVICWLFLAKEEVTCRQVTVRITASRVLPSSKSPKSNSSFWQRQPLSYSSPCVNYFRSSNSSRVDCLGRSLNFAALRHRRRSIRSSQRKSSKQPTNQPNNASILLPGGAVRAWSRTLCCSISGRDVSNQRNEILSVSVLTAGHSNRHIVYRSDEDEVRQTCSGMWSKTRGSQRDPFVERVF
jgi:hypothetical protein